MSKKIVVIAATEMELAQCRAGVELAGVGRSCEFVVGGLGATNTAIATYEAIKRCDPNVIIQIGIAGAIDKSLQIGDVVFVIEDHQSDLGAWRGQNSLFEPFDTPRIAVANPSDFKGVRARSVNTACSPVIPLGDAQIESMEGAAFFQAASGFEGVRFFQIRSISNYMDTPRSEWDIPLAVSALPGALSRLIDVLTQ